MVNTVIGVAQELPGEAEPVRKQPGDTVLSGRAVVALWRRAARSMPSQPPSS